MQQGNDQITETLIGLIAEHVPHAVEELQIRIDTNLYDLGLDSTAAINLMLSIEEKFGVTFPDSLIDEGTFQTPEALRVAVSSLLS